MVLALDSVQAAVISQGLTTGASTMSSARTTDEPP